MVFLPPRWIPFVLVVFGFLSAINVYSQPKLTPYFRLESSAVIQTKDIINKDWDSFQWHQDMGIASYDPDSIRLKFFDGNEKMFYVNDWKKDGDCWFSKVTNPKGIVFWLYIEFLPKLPGKLFIFVCDSDGIGLAYKAEYNAELAKKIYP